MRHLIIGLLCLVLVGCASVGTMRHTTQTQTDLTRKNYQIVKSGVQGQSTGFRLLWFIPIVSPSYAGAMANLHTKVRMEGKAMALANVAQDQSLINLILISFPKITITADVVEFLEEQTNIRYEERSHSPENPSSTKGEEDIKPVRKLAVQKARSKSPGQSWRIMTVQSEHKFVIINAKEGGLEVEETYDVYDGESPVGQVKVTKLDKALAVADIVLEVRSGAIKEGNVIQQATGK